MVEAEDVLSIQRVGLLQTQEAVAFELKLHSGRSSYRSPLTLLWPNYFQDFRCRMT